MNSVQHHNELHILESQNIIIERKIILQVYLSSKVELRSRHKEEGGGEE